MRPLLAGLLALLTVCAASASQADDSLKAPTSYTPAARPVEAGFVPKWLLKATLYHSGAVGVGAKDSLGCRPVAMRTVAVDPTYIPRRTILFIAETVGLPLPGGGAHDGYWYASDTGGAIKGPRIDLFTGANKASMGTISHFNLKKLSASKVGAFKGCPPANGGPVAAQ